MKKLTAVLMSIMVCCYSFAQTGELDPVTVTANSIQQKASLTGRDVVIIRGEKFNQLPVHSIDELLRYLPGVEVQMRGGMGSQSDILLRGGTFQQVLVLLDGIRLNDPLTGHFNSYIPISVAEIERIEIVKGASSAIYGSDAVGGVIHIISKTFNAKKENKKPSGDATLKLGEYGLASGNAGMHIQNKKTAIGFGVVSNNAEGVRQRGTTGFLYNSTGSASIKQDLQNNWSLAYRGALDKRNFSAQNFYTAFYSDTAKEMVTTLWNHAQLAYDDGAERLSIDLGYKTARDEYTFNKNAAANDNKSKVFQALVTHSYRYSKRFNYKGGLQFVDKSIKSNDRGNHSIFDAGAFLVFGYTPIEDISITPAIRLNWNENGNTAFLPQLNIAIKKNKTVFRGSVGKSIRDADFTERYNNYNKPLVTSGNIGNQNLLIEKSWSYEGGIDWFATNAIKLSATAFYKQYYQLIDWMLTPYSQMPRNENLVPTGSYFLAKNIANVRTAGIETSISYNKDFGKHHSLFATAGATWIDSDDKQNSKSLYISSHADLLANLNVIYRWKQVTFGVNGLYKKRPTQTGNASLAQLSKAYSVWNMRLNYTLIGESVSVFAEVDNVLNAKYADRFGVPMPGRWVMGGISVRW